MWNFLTENQIKSNYQLAQVTTMGVGGYAKWFLSVELSQLRECVVECKDNQLPYIVVGNGSNIVISDKGYNGVVISINKHACDIVRIVENDAQDRASIVESDGGVVINVNASCMMSQLVKWSYDNNCTGLEWATSLPSTIGGAIYGNAGVGNDCIGNIVKSCKILDNDKIMLYNNNDCKFDYRYSCFKDSFGLSNPPIIISADLVLKQSNKKTILDKIKFYAKNRATQPKGKSCGCVFKNGYYNGQPYSAGQIIDSCGLKGLRVGGAVVSDIHANFIINDSQALAQDIHDLVGLIQSKVFIATNIKLQTELEFIGEFDIIENK